MNYIHQLNGFWNWRKLNELTSKEAYLYFAILDCANSSYWKREFNAPNSTLESMCLMSKSELNKHRNALVQKGLILYKNGKKGLAGTYIISPLCDTNIDTNPDTNIDTNPDTNVGNIHKQKQKEIVSKKDALDISSVAFSKRPKNNYENLINGFTDDEGLKIALWAYIQMRVKKKAAPTDHALELVLKHLAEMSGDVAVQVEILNRSTVSNWTDIFPLRENNVQSASNYTRPNRKLRFANYEGREWNYAELEKLELQYLRKQAEGRPDAAHEK